MTVTLAATQKHRTLRPYFLTLSFPFPFLLPVSFPALSSFPFPSSFPSILSFILYPRSVFVQYVQQGVFDLSPKFVRQVLDRLAETEGDRKLKYLLLNNVSEVPFPFPFPFPSLAPSLATPFPFSPFLRIFHSFLSFSSSLFISLFSFRSVPSLPSLSPNAPFYCLLNFALIMLSSFFFPCPFLFLSFPIFLFIFRIFIHRTLRSRCWRGTPPLVITHIAISSFLSTTSLEFQIVPTSFDLSLIQTWSNFTS